MTLQLPAGYSLHVYDEVDSTNSFIKENGFANGSIVLAKSQKVGRGKCDSVWVSPPGNLYFSLMLDYFVRGQFSIILHLVFLVAISVREALGIEQVKYSWPNDLVLYGKKFAGILIETVVNKSIVIGVGLNIVSAPHGATTILAHDRSLEQKPIDLLKKIIVSFDKNKKLWLQGNNGFDFIQSEWNANAFKINESVTFKHGEELVTGVLMGIDKNGAILIENEGVTISFYTGSLCTL